jgi:protein-S-isoprenylcysteine O-methyltransferase Ste14
MDNRRITSIISGVGFVLWIAIWAWQVRAAFLIEVSLSIAIGGTLLLYPLTGLGRWLLDRNPTVNHVYWINAWMHLGIYLLLGSAIFEAVRVIPDFPVGKFQFPTWLGIGLIVLTSVLTVLAMVNLALRGLGAPFAVALSRKVASNWMYAWTRNPMVFSTWLAVIAFGLYTGSSLFLIWTLAFLGPSWIFVVKFYEERELEIRFGGEYLDYKRRTPFLWPHYPRKAKNRIK